MFILLLPELLFFLLYTPLYYFNTTTSATHNDNYYYYYLAFFLQWVISALVQGVKNTVQCFYKITTSACNHILGDIIAAQTPDWARVAFALQPPEEAQRLMYASFRPQTPVVQWDPGLLISLTWLTQDVHQGAPLCNLLDFNLCEMNSLMPIYIRGHSQKLDYLYGRMSHYTPSPSGCVYICSMTWFNQWNY